MGDVEPIRRSILVVGDKGVGKSCIVQCFKDWTTNSLDFTSPVNTKNEPTIGVDPLTIEFKTGCHFRLFILDTSGDDRFTHVVRTHYNGHVVLLVYDVNNPASYEKAITHYLPLVRGKQQQDGVPIIVIGNKQEKQDDNNNDNGAAGVGGVFMRPCNLPPECMFAAVSCRTGLGVYDLCEMITGLCAREVVGMEELNLLL